MNVENLRVGDKVLLHGNPENTSAYVVGIELRRDVQQFGGTGIGDGGLYAIPGDMRVSVTIVLDSRAYPQTYKVDISELEPADILFT